MRSDQFKSLLGGLPGLTAKQLDELRGAVEAQYQRTQALRALEAAGEGAGVPALQQLQVHQERPQQGPSAVPVHRLFPHLQRRHEHAAVADAG